MKNLDKSGVDKSVTEKKIVAGHMPWCTSTAAVFVEELKVRISKSGHFYEVKMLLISQICVSFYSILHRFLLSPCCREELT